MAEGMSRLNQHVLHSSRWGASERIARPEFGSGVEVRFKPFNDPAEPGSAQVRRAVEADVIPRILLERGVAEGASDVVRFAELLLTTGHEAEALARVTAFRARGHAVEDVYLDLFQPAARHIGNLWAEDLCTFVDVTLALGTLHRMLRDFSPEFHKDSRFDAGRRALLVPLPGDQHTFGLSMVAEFFRRSGWGVWSAPFETEKALGAALQDTWFTVVGFSVSLLGQLDQLARVIDLVRRRSCNSDVKVLVGGPVFVEHPEHAARVGADAVGEDARHAVFQAEGFAARMVGR